MRTISVFQLADWNYIELNNTTPRSLFHVIDQQLAQIQEAFTI